MIASKAGNMECVKVLLDKGAEVNIQDTVSGLSIHRMQCSLYPESHFSIHSEGNVLVTQFHYANYTNA